MNEQSGRLNLNGHSLYWVSAGPADGPAVMLLHHGLGSSYSWKDQLPALAEAGYHAIAYDRWGYGRSGARGGLGVPHFREDQNDLAGLMSALQIERAALVGHSDGGTIALAFAANQPALVSCLVTVAAHIYVEPKMEPGILGIQAAFETEARFRQGLRRLHGEQVEQVFHNWFDGWLHPGNLSWDMRPLLRQIRCPVLVVQGQEDEHATQRHAQDLAAAIPAAELWLVPDAAHMLPQDHPAEFNARLLSFLSQHFPS